MTALVSATESGKAESSEPTSPSECLNFAQDAIESGVEYHLSNLCKRRFACSLEWTVSCGDSAPYRHYHHKASVWLGAKGDQSVKANVDVCKKDQGWSISDPAWACTPQ